VRGVICLLGLTAPYVLCADTPRPAPDFKQVYELIQQHLAGANQPELNRAAVQCLISSLAPKVSIVGTPASEDKESVLVTQASLFDGPIAYIRVGRVDSGLEKAVREAWQKTGTTNKIAGLVLDLRFTQGTDYDAAIATAQLFIKKEQPLLDWGKGMVRSKENPQSIAVPVAVLVNEKTAAAAEALAAVLRAAGSGLILGTRTAGQAMIGEEFPLSNGESLRIATTPIHLGDGASLSADGIKPDISVAVSPADERAYYADAFKELTKAPAPDAGGATNSASVTSRARRPRFNEAELVRERKNGVGSQLAGTDNGDNDKPVVRDPVLGRALDFLKGLSLVRSTRSLFTR
jgi:hypothetical protein